MVGNKCAWANFGDIYPSIKIDCKNIGIIIYYYFFEPLIWELKVLFINGFYVDYNYLLRLIFLVLPIDNEFQTSNNLDVMDW